MRKYSLPRLNFGKLKLKYFEGGGERRGEIIFKKLQNTQKTRECRYADLQDISNELRKSAILLMEPVMSSMYSRFTQSA